MTGLIKQSLDAYVNSTRRIFPQDRSQTVGASESGPMRAQDLLAQERGRSGTWGQARP